MSVCWDMRDDDNNPAEKMDELLAEATKEEQPGGAEYHIAPGHAGLQED